LNTEKQDNTPSDGLKLWPSLLWLADAPLFIDEKLVDRFYDAIVQPQGEQMSTTLEVSEEKTNKLSATLELGVKVSPSSLLTSLSHFLPFLSVEAHGDATGSAEHGSAKTQSRSIELHTIKTPQRQLVNLALHYLINQPERMYLKGDPADTSWREPQFIAAVPRAIVFLDLPGQDAQADSVAMSVTTKLIPMAAEFSNGNVIRLFDQMRSQNGRESPPPHPSSHDPATQQSARQQYWQWFDTNFNATQAMEIIEDAASSNGRIRWIDFRLPISSDGGTLHLHLCPAEAYDTGSFAYQLVKRGFKHGLRIVGTLKSEPDLNVLAIYEK
jgi:hypothetical protein